MKDLPPQRNILRGWWGIVALVVVCLLIAVAVFFWWYHSTADLEQIRAEAKKRGIPTTWVEGGVVASPTDVVAKYERLGALSSRLKDYDSLVALGKAGTNAHERLQAFLPIPSAAVEHHASLDAALVAEYLDLLDHLPHLPVVGEVERNFATRLPAIGWVRQLARFQGERILLASVADLPREVERALHLLEVFECRSCIELMVHYSLVAMASQKIAARLPELRSAMPDLPQRLNQLAERNMTLEITCFVGEFLQTLNTSEHLSEIKSVTVLGHPGFDSAWMDRLVFRAGRSKLLTNQLSWIEMTRSTSTPGDRLTNAKVIQAATQRLRRWMPSDILPLISMSNIPVMLRMAVHGDLSLRLLAAELRSEPWPTDPFDPTGSPLRRLERDGKVMGAYSVDENGVDDGGKKGKDRYFPLYGPLTPPAPATTTPSP